MKKNKKVATSGLRVAISAITVWSANNADVWVKFVGDVSPMEGLEALATVRSESYLWKGAQFAFLRPLEGEDLEDQRKRCAEQKGVEHALPEGKTISDWLAHEGLTIGKSWFYKSYKKDDEWVVLRDESGEKIKIACKAILVK